MLVLLTLGCLAVLGSVHVGTGTQTARTGGPRTPHRGHRPRTRRAAGLGRGRAYLDFAEHHPAVYDALFQLDGGLPYAREDTPEPLKDAFAALLECLAEVAGDGTDPGMFTEVFWASLHGLATLTRAGRLLPQDAERRVELLADRLPLL